MPSQRARSRCSRSRRDPSRRRSPVPPVRVRRPRPRRLAWPRGARAVPAPAGTSSPGAPRACAAVMDAFRSSVSRSVAPSSPCATPRIRSAAGNPPTSRWEPIERQIRVGERTFDTVPHHVRAQRRDPRLDRGAAIRQRARRGRPVGERQQPLRIRRAARSARGSTLRRRRVQDAAPARPRRTTRATPPRSASGRRSRAAARGASSRPATVSVSPAACP